MSKIVRVQDGDYKVIVGSSTNYGNILLDTNPQGGSGQGEVRITGDLIVEGNTTTIESETLTVKDNIIYLNVGETNYGVATLGTKSGVQIDRGQLPDVSLLWDESITSEDPTGALAIADPAHVNGTFVLRDALNNLRALGTNSINTLNSDLAVDVGLGGVIYVTADGTTYAGNILDYSKLGLLFNINAVERTSDVATVSVSAAHGLVTGDRVTVSCFGDPTFNAVDVGITVIGTTSFTYSNVGADQILVPETGEVIPSAIINDSAIPNIKAVEDLTSSTLSTFTPTAIRENDTKVQVYDFDTSGVSEITMEVDGTQKAVLNSTGFQTGNLLFNDNNISNISNDNILLDNVLNIANKLSVPTTPTGYVKLYSTNIPGNGGTGLYFVNTTGVNDELVSKTRALLYSLIL